ncbi:unnamed protein product [Paramecium octaurelia]|uniref:Uncharacterized protein n=1 Tax=Paramecium octaurelia TaxID=43137 RepID=A0A8S1TBY8_PAROT|nr:unnamed protein product [Paramecium octaurelia]
MQLNQPLIQFSKHSFPIQVVYKGHFNKHLLAKQKYPDLHVLQNFGCIYGQVKQLFSHELRFVVICYSTISKFDRHHPLRGFTIVNQPANYISVTSQFKNISKQMSLQKQFSESSK